MRKIYLLIIATIITIGAKAQTSVPGGNVSGVWTLAGSPYNVQGNIHINNANTLTIEPGVVVNFQGPYRLRVYGRLMAVGTIADSIVFTASGSNNPWEGIIFDSTPPTNDTSKIIYCKLQYGRSGNNYLHGGAIHFWNVSKVVVSNCTITKCVAQEKGGAIYCGQNSSPIITYNTITNDTARFNPEGCGGGIAIDGGSPVISNNIIAYNNASHNGGGIYFNYNSTPIIKNNIISNNTASDGGGIYISNISNAKISNNVIANNTATNGGGIYSTNDNQSALINNTIVNNSADVGGGFYSNEASTPVFTNCILWGNTSITSGNQVFLFDTSSVPNFYYCNVQDGVEAFELNGNSYSGSYQNSIDTLPLFVLPSTGSGDGFNGLSADWKLQSGSPCIDSGSPSTILSQYDIEGNPRISHCIVDIGAYEYQLPGAFTVAVNQTATITCFGDTTGALQAIASGIGAPYAYLWTPGNDTASSFSNLSAGTYTLTASNSIGCVETIVTIIEQPSMLIQISKIDLECQGLCTGVATINVSGDNAPFTYLWNTSSADTVNSIDSLCLGTYSLVINDSLGCSYLENVTIENPISSFTINALISNATCANNDGTISISPSIPEEYTYLWSNSSINQNISGLESGFYSVTVTDTNGCFVLDTFNVGTSNIVASTPICLVTVDSTSTKNIIIWEKPISTVIDSFRVYREIASSYSFVGSVSYNELSEFVDNSVGVNPNTTSYKYKITTLDTCGNESVLSSEHQTSHLQISPAIPQGVNLSWNDYQGFSFSQYRILRDDLGNGNWQAVDSVSFGTTTYTSTDVLPNARFIVEAKNPIPCISTRSNYYVSSKSNTASQTTGISEVSEKQLIINISPNPANDKIVIKVTGSQFSYNDKYQLKLINLLGECVLTDELEGNRDNLVDLSTINAGVYFVTVYNNGLPYITKIIKQ